MKFDAIIVGAGAAGLFCAFQAGKRGRKVLVIEHNSQIGRKILISGGGRCNFTNIDVKPENFISQNPHFCKSALARYTPQDFINLVKTHRIAFYEKKLGQLFCRESSRLIAQMLLAECETAKVRILTNCSVKKISKDKNFTIETNQGVFQSENLIIATGGLSFPKIGATDFGYRIAQQFGLKVVETRPSLVPLVFSGGTSFSKLAGISIESIVTTAKHSFRENILFTHRGLSGPAILQISNYWQKGKNLNINLLPDNDLREILENNYSAKQNLANFLSKFLPNRFAEVFTENFLANKPINQLNNKEIEKIAESLNHWTVSFRETEGYQKAEVTLGGIDTNELSSQTMESKKIQGLYFIGEIIDVTGWLGGYNFQWAWASGFAAGNAI